jgi:O-antigen/teichoic acid export membrane protein
MSSASSPFAARRLRRTEPQRALRRLRHVTPQRLTAVPEPERKPARRELGGFISLAGVQVFQLFTGLITAPLIAHALGAERRGLLAAVAVPLGVGAYILQLGLGQFAINRVAKGDRVNVVFGSLALPLIVVGGLVGVLSPAIAHGLSGGRQPVQTYLTIGFLMMPITLLIYLSMSIATGLARWRALAVARLVSPLLMCVGVVALAVIGRLTLEGAIVLTLVSGLLPILALGSILRRAFPPSVDLALVRRGLSFGSRASAGVIATMANQRLDQLLMVPLVPARQLGLYTVAVTIASLSAVLTSQIVTVVLPRIAAGETRLLAQATRYVVFVTVVTGLVIAAATWLLLVPFFGSDFANARPLVYVLVIGWVSLAGLSTLSQGLPAVGRPGAPSVGEMISLAITVPGLVVLLPTMGAMGAALISVLAYTTTLGVLIVIAARHLGDRPTDYVLLQRGDLATLIRLASSSSVGKLLRRRLALR